MIVGGYRPPNIVNIKDFFNTFIQVVNKIQSVYNAIVIMGGFNIHFCKQDKYAKEFFYNTESFGLKQKNFDFTRITNSTNSCIDNVFSNIQKCEAKVISTAISDHEGILFTIKSKILPKVQLLQKNLW